MSKHGGARYHPPGREGGRPSNEYPTRTAKFQATEAEWQDWQNSWPSDTRKKFEYINQLMEIAMQTHAKKLRDLSRVFFSKDRPLEMAAKTIRDANKRLFNDEESLQEVVWGVLAKGHPATRLPAVRAFADYFVSEIFINTMRGDENLLAPGSKTFSQLRTAYHAISESKIRNG